MKCNHDGIFTLGIGIGIYPCGIYDMFPRVIFSPNPNYLIYGIASLFDDDSAKLFDKIIMPGKMGISIIRLDSSMSQHI